MMTKEQRHECMAAIKGKDTKPEMIVRRFLHSAGYRYRLHDRKLLSTRAQFKFLESIETNLRKRSRSKIIINS